MSQNGSSQKATEVDLVRLGACAESGSWRGPTLGVNCPRRRGLRGVRNEVVLPYNLENGTRCHGLIGLRGCRAQRVASNDLRRRRLRLGPLLWWRVRDQTGCGAKSAQNDCTSYGACAVWGPTLTVTARPPCGAASGSNADNGKPKFATDDA